MIQPTDNSLASAGDREVLPEPDPVARLVMLPSVSEDEATLRTRLSHYESLVEGAEPISVLIVDDDQLTLKLLSLSLDSVGHTVVGKVARASEALRKAVELKPDLVILDVGMPDGDGIDIAEKIASSLDIPTLICSGCSKAETVQRVSRSHMHIKAYLVKPFSQAQLTASVCIAIGQHRHNLAGRLLAAKKGPKAAVQ